VSLPANLDMDDLLRAARDRARELSMPGWADWFEKMLASTERATFTAPPPAPPRSKAPASGEEAAEAGAQKVADASINGRAVKHKRRSKGVRKN
jgi:hypothetical protein